MPQIIQYIDKICRDKQRDVLYITFDRNLFTSADWNSWLRRNEILEWLHQNNINYSPCGNVASEFVFSSYMGQIYIDVPYDVNDPNFIKLRNYFEYTDGRSKIEGVNFCYLPLEHAMKNQHHDEPDFWEKLMADF